MSQMLICMSRNILNHSKMAFPTFGARCIQRSSGLLRRDVSSVRSITFQTVWKLCRFRLLCPEQKPVSQIARRHFAKRPDNRSFEVDANVANDVTIFTYSNARFFRMLSIFGIVQFFFWAHMAVFAYSGLTRLDTGPSEGQSSWSSMILNFQNQYKDRIAVACIALGYVVLFFTWIYPLRTISKLILQKGGQKVRITTYNHFGRTKDFVVPLQDISCTQSRLAKGVQVSVKIRGRWFYYLMDKREGKFVEPHLFDYVIGLNRSLK